MNNTTNIIALETTETLLSVCLFKNETIYTETNLHIPRIHSQKIMQTIDQTLKNANVALNDVSFVAISEGPGSFTGLRIGYSAAKGLCLGNDLPLVPVPTYNAFALNIAAFLPNETEYCIANKVNNSELYFSSFIAKEKEYKQVTELEIISNDQLLEKSRGNLIFGNFQSDAIQKKYPIASTTAYWIAKWALRFAHKRKNANFDLLEPVYFKDFVVKTKKKEQQV